MKKLYFFVISLFLSIWNFFFGKEEKKKVVEEKVSIPQIRYTNHPSIPIHNNRKNARGRFTQYVPLENGSFRPIYHAAK